MKRLISVVMLCCFFFGISCPVYANDLEAAVKKYKKANQTQRLQIWGVLASEVNKSLPLRVDSKTTALNASPTSKGLNYNFEIDNYTHADLLSGEWPAILALLKTKATNKYCTDPDMMQFREFSAVLKYKYYDNFGNFIGDFFVTIDDCQ